MSEAVANEHTEWKPVAPAADAEPLTREKPLTATEVLAQRRDMWEWLKGRYGAALCTFGTFDENCEQASAPKAEEPAKEEPPPIMDPARDDVFAEIHEANVPMYERDERPETEKERACRESAAVVAKCMETPWPKHDDPIIWFDPTLLRIAPQSHRFGGWGAGDE